VDRGVAMMDNEARGLILKRLYDVHASQNVQIGGQGNVQIVTMDVDKMITAVESSNATFAEREEAKSILKKDHG
jgi:hypothetical protein